jgi:heat shock protein HspQ
MIMSASGQTTCRAKFSPGNIVHHKRYDYRGVIVERDDQCAADATWYQNNMTQPDCNQPWYHVLVHGTGSVTYVAQSNLEPDPSDEPIEHPYVPIFFDEYADGRYVRNKQPWPGWEK